MTTDGRGVCTVPPFHVSCHRLCGQGHSSWADELRLCCQLSVRRCPKRLGHVPCHRINGMLLHTWTLMCVYECPPAASAHRPCARDHGKASAGTKKGHSRRFAPLHQWWAWWRQALVGRSSRGRPTLQRRHPEARGCSGAGAEDKTPPRRHAARLVGVHARDNGRGRRRGARRLAPRSAANVVPIP